MGPNTSLVASTDRQTQCRLASKMKRRLSWERDGCEWRPRTYIKEVFCWSRPPTFFKNACQFHSTAPLVGSSSFAKYACKLHTRTRCGGTDRTFFFFTYNGLPLFKAIPTSVRRTGQLGEPWARWWRLLYHYWIRVYPCVYFWHSNHMSEIIFKQVYGYWSYYLNPGLVNPRKLLQVVKRLMFEV